MAATVAGTGKKSAAGDFVADAARNITAGDAAAALQSLHLAAAIDAKSPRLRFVMGLLAWRLGDLAQALPILHQCHDEAPENGTIAEVLASLLAQSGNLPESLYYGKLSTAYGVDADFAALLPPFFPSFGKAFLSIQERPLLARARMSMAGGNLRLGIELARQHVALTPGDLEARLLLAESLLRAGFAAAAVEALQVAVAAGAAAPEVLSLYGRALAAVGETDAARRTHDAACDAAPKHAAIHAARLADAIWLERDPAALAKRTAEWAQRFLTGRKPTGLLPVQGKLVIGYLVSSLADPRDAAAIAAVARAHDRSRCTVIGFGIGAQSWEENAILGGAFDKWRDVSELDPATLARVLRGEGLNLAIDCSGFAAPRQLLALGRLTTAIRVQWLGLPPVPCRPLHDAVLGHAQTDAMMWRAGVGYPVLNDMIRPVERSTAAAARFGSDASLAQLDGETVRLWSGVLAHAPGSTLALRANDMATAINIDRLVGRFGRDLAARIDIIDAAVPEDFYRQVDIALAPVNGVSPRMASEAIACGVPVVALDCGMPASPYGAFLRALGLGGSLVAADERDYGSIALTLAGSAASRDQIAATIAARAAAIEATPRAIAEAIETNAAAALAEAVRS